MKTASCQTEKALNSGSFLGFCAYIGEKTLICVTGCLLKKSFRQCLCIRTLIKYELLFSFICKKNMYIFVFYAIWSYIKESVIWNIAGICGVETTLKLVNTYQKTTNGVKL